MAVRDTITLALRDHIIKAGFDFSRVNSLQDTLLFEEGGYAYATFNDFIIDYSNFAAAGALRSAGTRVLGLRADRGAML